MLALGVTINLCPEPGASCCVTLAIRLGWDAGVARAIRPRVASLLAPGAMASKMTHGHNIPLFLWRQAARAGLLSVTADETTRRCRRGRRFGINIPETLGLMSL